MSLLRATLALAAAGWLGLSAGAAEGGTPGVVINELMYHPPDDRDDLQWIELHNPGEQPVDLGGWTLRGVRHTFPAGTGIPPGGYLVLARDAGAFRIRYGRDIPVGGEFQGRLKHGGERIELLDASKRRVDTVEYDDREPWPLSPDGLGASLERITASGAGDDPRNWAPSPLPPERVAAGTPGRANASAAANPPPVIEAPGVVGTEPNRSMPVRVRVRDSDGVATVRLRYRVLSASDAGNRARNPVGWESITMPLRQGDALDGLYEAEIPPQPEGHLVRWRIEATDATGVSRTLPHPDDARPSWSYYVGPNTNTAQVPVAAILEFGPPEAPGSSIRTMHGRPGRNSRAQAEPSRGDSALILMRPGVSHVELFDHIRVTPRNGGWKVRLHKDRLLDEMSTVNVIFEGVPRFVLAEHLAYELYRAAGVPAPLSGHWRILHNGVTRGYHLFVEQPNSAFLRRNGRDDEGDLFKLLWYGGDVVGQHEKKNNPESGHAGLVSIIDALNQTSGAEQWSLIEKHFNVPIFASYYAVNMCIQNWDGFFNNYFLYRPPGEDGRWEIFPWDEDKTWGYHDGVSPSMDWYSMPLTMGMAGDRPPRSISAFFNRGPFGGTAWWRPPGWFSGPLLANPEFRRRFLERTRELCETAFTPEAMEPAFARLERQLVEEVRHRAAVNGASESAAVDQFRKEMESFRRQVVERRRFVLRELAKRRGRASGPPTRERSASARAPAPARKGIVPTDGAALDGIEHPGARHRARGQTSPAGETAAGRNASSRRAYRAVRTEPCQARISLTTRPATSVRRKSRP